MSMSITDKLIEIAQAEWQRWGYSTKGLAGGGSKIAGIESKLPYVAYVNDYWRAVNQPTWNGNTPQPWSAAFISFCFKQAGAGAHFPYNQGHAGYCSAFIRKPNAYPGLSLVDPISAAPSVGDLVLAARSGGECVKPPSNYADALAKLQDGGWFCSHVDIVVAVRDRQIDVIGGNVANSVTMSTLAAQQDGTLSDPRFSWLGVIRNTIVR